MVDWLAGKRVKGTSSERYGYNNSYPDSLHFSANGQVLDAPTQNATGKVGTYAWSFDGSNDGVRLGSSASDWNFIHNNTAKVTISFWLKTSTSHYGIIIANNLASATVGFYCYVQPDGSLQFWVGRGVSGTNVVSINSGASVVPFDGTWHHYVITYDYSLSSNNAIIYKDGSSVTTATKSGNSASNSNAVGGIYMGTHSNTYYLNGTLDDFAVWNRVLTSSEVSALHASGTGKSVTQAISDGEVSVTGLKAYYNFEQTGTKDHLLNIANDYVTPTFDSGTIVNGMSATGNKLISSGVTGSGWTAYIRSNDYVNINDGGGDLYFVGQSYSPSLAIGFEKSPHNQYPSAVYQNANYGWHTTSSTNNIYEKTSLFSATASVNDFQIHKINMDSNGTVKYYIGDGFNNMTLYRTSGTTASADNYYINASFSGSSSDIAYVYLYKKTNQIPNIQDGTIFEETDTNKAYIWSSSSQTWTQL